MELVTEVIRSGASIIERFAILSGKSFPAALLQAGRGAIRHVISITPPASASGIARGLDSGSAAKQRGFAAIRRDLNHAFAPVRLKHKRKERIPSAELVTIHRRLLARKRPGSPMRRDRGQPYYVDVRKLRALETDLRAHVGKLASGWLPAAQRLNVAGPAWISRHGGRNGAFAAELDGTLLVITATNYPSAHAPDWVQPELQRRAHYAEQYALNDLRRQLPYLFARNARAAGLEVG